jgi:hypothetical protein
MARLLARLVLSGFEICRPYDKSGRSFSVINVVLKLRNAYLPALRRSLKLQCGFEYCSNRSNAANVFLLPVLLHIDILKTCSMSEKVYSS